MPKTLNMELKKYIIELTEKKLEACPNFVKVFGQGFVKRKLRRNIRNVYSNMKSDDKKGFYSFVDKDITICASGIDGSLLTQEDIEKDEDIQETATHEAIHAMLLKNEKECEELGIKNGTGILEVREDGTEIGRGHNEGLTVWLTELAGFKSRSYENLTNNIYQLEGAIGTRNILKMAKGDIKNNVTRCLGMGRKECERFLALGDQQYTLYTNQNFFNGIYKWNILELDEEKKQELLEKLRTDIRLQPCLDSEEFLGAQSEKEQLEVLFAFAKEQAKIIEKQKRSNALRLDSVVFNKYFKEEFDEIRERNKISKRELRRFSLLRGLMQKAQGTQEERIYSSIEFQEDLKMLEEQYMEETYKKAEKALHKGKLSGKVLERYLGDVGASGEGQINVFLNRIATKISYSCRDDIVDLLSRLYEQGRLREADRYSIRKVMSGEEEVTIFSKDGIIEGSRYGAKVKNVPGYDEENISDYFDFTLIQGEDFQSIINNFLKLKARLLEKDPKVKIQILDRAIIARGASGEQIYIISENEITEAERIEEIDLDPEQRKPGKRLLKERNLLDRIRTRIFKNQHEGKRLAITANDYNERQSKFRNNIRDMSNYTKPPMESAARIDTKDIEKEDDTR